jgi:hypothetical protein
MLNSCPPTGSCFNIKTMIYPILAKTSKTVIYDKKDIARIGFYDLQKQSTFASYNSQQ